MKKLLLFGMLLAASAASQAQVVLWNGDDKEVGSDGGFWNRADPTVVEDNGNRCLKFTLKASFGDWLQEHLNAALPVGDADFKGLRRITFRLKMAEKHNVRVQLEGKEGAYNTNRVFWYDTPNEWQTMVYEFSVGPDADKVTDTGNNVIAIWPYEEEMGKIGQTVYIDDIQLEGPMVNDVAVRTLEDASLSDRQVIVKGTLRKGTYQVTWEDPWRSENYDDYSLLLSKLSDDVSFLNLTEAAVSDGDSDQLRQKNPNLLILSPVDFFVTNNVIRWDAENESNATPKMLLNEAYPFYTPIDFQAAAVDVTRSTVAGTNSFCLPFYVGNGEIDGENGQLYLYKEQSAGDVIFTEADHADANIPFLMTGIKNAATVLSFTDKGVVNTDGMTPGDFVGVYAPQSAAGLWGIGSDNKFHQGGSEAMIRSFHAYVKANGDAPQLVLQGSEATGIGATLVNNEGVKNEIFNLNGQRINKLQKGLNIVNGKKVIK